MVNRAWQRAQKAADDAFVLSGLVILAAAVEWWHPGGIVLGVGLMVVGAVGAD